MNLLPNCAQSKPERNSDLVDVITRHYMIGRLSECMGYHENDF